MGHELEAPKAAAKAAGSVVNPDPDAQKTNDERIAEQAARAAESLVEAMQGAAGAMQDFGDAAVLPSKDPAHKAKVKAKRRAAAKAAKRSRRKNRR